MKTLMFTALALTASLTCFGAKEHYTSYTPSPIPASLSKSDVTPGEINYQGVLRNPKNSEEYYKDGIYDLECRLYTQESGSVQPIWAASYSAYVKDGYFNLMLGSSGKELSNSNSYKPTDLWKAMWFRTGDRDLYLGVTPRQDANHAAITSPTEISPRQKLLTVPFAFRAQKAQYADEAPGAFKVADDLWVGGDVTFSSGNTLTLKNISASDSAIKVGTSKSSPAATTLQGGTVTIEAGTALNVNSHGNATVTMDAGKTLAIGGGHVGVNNQSVTLRSSSSAYVDGGAEMTLKADEVRGAGPLRWNIKGRNDGSLANYTSPIILRRVRVPVDGSGDVGAFKSLKECQDVNGEYVNTVGYVWSVVGVNGLIGNVKVLRISGVGDSAVVWYYMNNVAKSHVGYFEVDVLGVSKWWADDNRGN